MDIWRRHHAPANQSNYLPRSPSAFVDDMRAYFAEKNPIKRDEIAGRQMHVLREYQAPREKPVRIPDVKEMFVRMSDQGHQ